jgi:uncharacterized protein with GYD domain
MPKYVVLYKFTDQGAKTIKDTVQRARDNRTESERRGFTIHGVYWTQGQYDLVTIVEAPNETAMMTAMLGIVSAGNAKSETMRAFDENEMQQITAALS